jgi:hypothetical protein
MKVTVLLSGLFTSDLTYLMTMEKRKGEDLGKNGHGTVAEKIEIILDQIEHYQQSEYTSIECLPHIEKYLLSVEYIEEFQSFIDEDNFRLSVKREPSGGSQSPESSKLHHTPRARPPRPFSAADGFISPSFIRRRLYMGSSSSSDPLESPTRKPFKPGHRKSRSLGYVPTCAVSILCVM